MMRGLSSSPLCTYTRGVTHEWDSLHADPSEGPSVPTGMLPKEARQDGAEIGLLPDISGSNNAASARQNSIPTFWWGNSTHDTHTHNNS
jgi:hypothetical protein